MITMLFKNIPIGYKFLLDGVQYRKVTLVDATNGFIMRAFDLDTRCQLNMATK